MAYELIIRITDIKNLLALTEVSTRMGKIVSLKEVDENERRPARRTLTPRRKRYGRDSLRELIMKAVADGKNTGYEIREVARAKGFKRNYLDVELVRLRNAGVLKKDGMGAEAHYSFDALIG
jgi:hypothetical protein